MQCLVAEKMALNEKLVTLTHEASGPLEKVQCTLYMPIVSCTHALLCGKIREVLLYMC